MKAMKFAMVVAMVAFGLSSVASGGSDESVQLRLKWRPGETLKYRIEWETDARAEGESLNLKFSAGLELQAMDSKTQSANAKGVGSGQLASSREMTKGPEVASPSLSFGEQLTEVLLRYQDVAMTVSASGQSLEINVGRDTVSARLNGVSLPSYQLEELRREAKPTQDILNTELHLFMTDKGRVVRVSGLEKLPATDQKEMAASLLDAMVLPDKPLRVGESLVEERNLESLLSERPGQERSPLSGKKLKIVRTLASVEKPANGGRVAKLIAPLKEKLDDITLDEDGTKGTVNIDVNYTSLVDVDRGVVLQEKAVGTVTMDPRGRGDSDLFAADVELAISLVEPKELARSVSATERRYK